MSRATARASVLDSCLPVTRALYCAARPLGSRKDPAAMASNTASSKRLRPAWDSQLSSIAWSCSPTLPSRSATIMSSERGVSLGLVEPRMKAWSRGSMVVVMSVAASASVRAMARRSEPGDGQAMPSEGVTEKGHVPIMSACARMATRRLMCSLMGTSTLPAMCPHFLVPGAWSSM